jgi:hypothetical protein
MTTQNSSYEVTHTAKVNFANLEDAKRFKESREMNGALAIMEHVRYDLHNYNTPNKPGHATFVGGYPTREAVNEAAKGLDKYAVSRVVLQI